MKNPLKVLAVAGVTGVLLFSTIVFIFPGKADAGANTVPIEGVSYNANAPVTDNLKLLMGKKVYIHLDSGEIFSGFVKDVGTHSLHLEKLDQRNFFDALIQIDHIIAIDTQFRKN